jgi:ribonucleoside-diphosphate reductase alpha chain
MYLLAWEKALKTTYYLRSLAATQIEKSTTDVNRRGLQPRWMKNKSASADVAVQRTPTPEEKTACSIEATRNGGICEACQ